MRQGSNGRRPRRNNSGRRNVPLRAQTFDSNGPEGRIRGTAHQVYEKYLALARDASAQSDRIRAENLMQHAEHYSRIINESMDPEDEAAAQERESRKPEARDGDGREARGDGRDGRDGREDGQRDGGQARDGSQARDGGQGRGNGRGNGRGRNRRRYPGRGGAQAGEGGDGAADGTESQGRADGESDGRGGPGMDESQDDVSV